MTHNIAVSVLTIDHHELDAESFALGEQGLGVYLVEVRIAPLEMVEIARAGTGLVKLHHNIRRVGIELLYEAFPPFLWKRSSTY